MTTHKLSRRRVLQLLAGTFAGAALNAQGLLRINAPDAPINKTLERIRQQALMDAPHGAIPHGLLDVPPALTPPPPGGRPRPPRPPANPPVAAATTPVPTQTAVPTFQPTPSPVASPNSGRFGRMFGTLTAFAPAGDDLRRLAITMVEGLNEDGTGPVEAEDATMPSNNAVVPAGYTYLGQFIDHDLTFDPTPMSTTLQSEGDPAAIRNFRTPRFDLDNLYGNGPSDNPFLYQSDGAHFLIGKNKTGEDDLPRNSDADDARALIGDPRNDENLIVSQLQLAFMKYHNRVVDELGARGNLFEEARRTVRLHYQWLVIHDFLTRIVGTAMVEDILKNKPQFFKINGQPYMPVEFSGAAYRFGHSMVRSNYSLNALTFGEDASGKPKEIVLFDHTAPTSVSANDLRGFRRRPANRQIDWSHLFAFPGKEDNLQVARAFDTQISHGLGALPTSITGDAMPSLPERNLKRGVMLGLPTGQAIGRAMHLPESQIISIDNPTYRFQVGTGYLVAGELEETVPDIAPSEKAYLEKVFGRETPLWYYILKEAELIGKGRQLGPVGGRIVAEVFIGLMQADKDSLLNVSPTWQPRKGQFGSRKDGEFTMVDLLQYIQ